MIGLIEFAKPFRGLDVDTLTRVLASGKKWTRHNRLPISKKNTSIDLLHGAHHDFAEQLARSGQRRFNKYRFAPITPQLVKKVKDKLKKYKKWRSFYIHEEITDRRTKRALRQQLKNREVENFVAGLEGLKPGNVSIDDLDSRSYWLGRRARKKLMPKDLKQATRTVYDDYDEGGRRIRNNPLQATVDLATQRALRTSTPTTAASTSFYYRTSTKGKRHKVRKNNI
jgi:hypothetical protein